MRAMKLTQRDLERPNHALAGRSPIAILTWAFETFGRRAAILTSMQRAGAVLCHMADRAGFDSDVLFVDTGVLHAETLAARDRLASTHSHLKVKTLAPRQTFEEQTEELGLLYLSKEGQERCCDLRKSEPLRNERGNYDALIGALRRDEGGGRAAVELLAIDPEMGALRVHPLALQTSDELAAYVRSHPDVVVNKLHLMGFPTIGCFPCTTPVRPDEPERAGRWRHLADVAYCGINPTDTGRSEAIEVSDRVARALEALST
jgi:phosphoadenosine phosphosulfate reductase